MRSIVFNSPITVMWFVIAGSILLGGIITTLIGVLFKNRILRESIERRIPEITEEYKTELAGAEHLISVYRKDIEILEAASQRSREQKEEAQLHALKIIQAVQDGHQ